MLIGQLYFLDADRLGHFVDEAIGVTSKSPISAALGDFSEFRPVFIHGFGFKGEWTVIGAITFEKRI